MTHGAPDYSNVSKEGLTYRIDDLGELSVRLGSPATYDRRGDVLWFDNFDDGLLAWEDTSASGDNTLTLSTDYKENGSFCAKLTAATTADKYASMTRRQPITNNPLIGVNVAFQPDNNCDEFQINIYYYDGTIFYTITLAFDFQDNELRLLHNDGTVTLSTNIAYLTGPDMFTHCKIAFNLSTFYFIYLTVNELSYDLSEYQIYNVPGVTNKHIRIDLQSYTRDTGTSIVYVDNVIYTTNEGA